MQLLTNGTKMHLFSICKKVRNDEQCLQKKSKEKTLLF
jgi:hypothetical protein